jgi:methyl-accepting chemotaxis protein WspA
LSISTVRSKIGLGFSAVILVMVALCAYAYVQLRDIEAQAIVLRSESVPGLYLAGRLQATSISTYTSVQQLILEQDRSRMQQIMAYLEEKTAERADLLKKYEPTVRTGRQRELYEATKAALAPYMVVRRQVEKLSVDPKTKAEASELQRNQLEPLYQKLQEAFEAEVSFNKATADGSGQQIQDSVSIARNGMLVSLLIGVILAVAAGFFVVQAIDRPLGRLVTTMEFLRDGDFSHKMQVRQDGEFGILAKGLNLVIDSLQEMIRRVQKSGLQVNTSATEIAATAQEQLSTASQVSTTTSEIGATSKEISATSRELVQTVKGIAEVAEKTAVLAGSGQTGLNRMKATMRQVTEAAASINARLGTLSEKAGNIGTVVTTITRVADQTNLLSLNAAIEAEKAGDFGRGFAVVATEIRRLADQTAIATGDIEQMVKEMQSAVAAGVMGMDKFSEEVRKGGEVVGQVSDELSQIIQHVQALAPNFESVSEGMQSQSRGAQQISEALSQLSEASQQTVESLRQSNSAIEQLNDASRGLQDGVACFKVRA